jgi:iron complex outermembrane receptor protein
MKRYSLKKSFAALLSLLSAASMVAQTTTTTTTATTTVQPPATAPDKTVKMEKYVVTGSYLPESATVSASPVVSIEAAEIGRSGATDPLQMLKQMTPYFAGNGNIGTESNNGYAGESNVALRNLETLVLINGQRMVNSPFSNTSGGTPAVDLNSIPTAMIERIDILKDGASTIYGSDAIGGVVNIILKKDYSGFEAGTRFGATQDGDYKTRTGYLIGGVSEPGVSITVGAQHFENTSLLTTDRSLTTLIPAQINALGFNVTSAVFSGSYPGRVGNDIVAGSPLAAGAPGFNASILTPPAKSSPSAAPLTLAQQEALGYYIPVSKTPLGIQVGSASILNTTLLGNDLYVPTKRNEFIANADKELFGKTLEVFGDFLFSQTTNGGSFLAPAPVAGVGPGGANALSIPANNPYNLFGVTIGVGQAAGAPSARTRLIEFGNRSSVNETNTWRFVGGLKGDLNDHYSWEADYDYSRAGTTEKILGGANGSAVNQAMIPLLNSTGGYVFNAAGRPLSILTDSAGNNLPVYDFFAVPGFNDPATINAVKATLFKSEASTLRDISVRLKGTPFELPAGDLSFALGVETRREELDSSVDALFASGLALGYNAAKTFPGGGGARSTTGEFIEFGVPVTSPKMAIPGLYTLEFNLADREEKIKPGGNANTPKFGVRWLPFDDSFVLRGTVSRGFIAPSVYRLFGPSAGNSPSVTIQQGNGTTGSGGGIAGTAAVQINSNELSNPSLLPSHSKSWTAGFVYSPKQVRGLSVSADYYHITQDKVGGIDYNSIFASLNALGSASPYAAGYIFADGTKLTSTAAKQITTTNAGTLSVPFNPAGDQWTDGLDLGVNYDFKTESIGTFGVGANANIDFNYKWRATSTSPYYQYARVFTDSTEGLGGYNGLLPSYLIKPYVNYSYKAISASLFMTYYPTVTAPGSLFAGQSTTNSDTINGLAYKIPSYFTMDATVSYILPDFGHSWMRNTTVSVGADNVFNKHAPYVPGDGAFTAEANTVKGSYDIFGRTLFVEVKKAF